MYYKKYILILGFVLFFVGVPKGYSHVLEPYLGFSFNSGTLNSPVASQSNAFITGISLYFATNSRIPRSFVVGLGYSYNDYFTLVPIRKGHSLYINLGVDIGKISYSFFGLSFKTLFMNVIDFNEYVDHVRYKLGYGFGINFNIMPISLIGAYIGIMPALLYNFDDFSFSHNWYQYFELGFSLDAGVIIRF